MQGRPRDPLHLWVVSLDTGYPSDYASHELDPNLAANPSILTTPDELRSWLEARAG
jgi:hypothetical protein